MPAFKPLVAGDTTSKSLNVGSIMDELSAKPPKIKIAEFQRDSAQWSVEKRSMFIESIINNLTVPPLIVYPEDDPATGREQKKVLDGQQRLTTIQQFVENKFALSGEDDVDYAENIGAIVQGKKFSDLPDDIQEAIKGYTVNLIILPKNLEKSLRLNIFRRINEAGVPLSAHDLRLAEFGDSERVRFIRIAGVFDPENREGSRRMLHYAKESYGLDYPWKSHDAWTEWWLDKEGSGGQAPSEMFLYYVLVRDLKGVETLLASGDLQQTLRLKKDGTTTTVLDLYCAQAQYQSAKNSPQLLASLDTLRAWFIDFEEWFNAIKKAKVPSIQVSFAKRIALFTAAATQTWRSPADVSESQWKKIQVLITKGPSAIESAMGVKYHSPRGKWSGQKKEIEKVFEIVERIAK